MPEQINWSFNVQIADGPQISSSKSLSVEAYDKIDVIVPGGDAATPGKLTVDVQPGAGGQVRFLVMTASLYDAKLTYKVDNAGSDIKFDSPLMLIGEGAANLLGATQKQFVFTNTIGMDKTVNVKILTGRDATPAP